jgi:hypothetical protein
MNWIIVLSVFGWVGGITSLVFALIALLSALLGESVRLFVLAFVAALTGIALIALGIGAS